mmetsp:Transcript_53183/g.119385  ORF Transcript_53183/g.119385 Transcript_53183/m.119385 type:complete len:251 (-) Transcript_53183:378-1130(-)
MHHRPLEFPESSPLAIAHRSAADLSSITIMQHTLSRHMVHLGQTDTIVDAQYTGRSPHAWGAAFRLSVVRIESSRAACVELIADHVREHSGREEAVDHREIPLLEFSALRVAKIFGGDPLANLRGGELLRYDGGALQRAQQGEIFWQVGRQSETRPLHDKELALVVESFTGIRHARRIPLFDGAHEIRADAELEEFAGILSLQPEHQVVRRECLLFKHLHVAHANGKLRAKGGVHRQMAHDEALHVRRLQ